MKTKKLQKGFYRAEYKGYTVDFYNTGKTWEIEIFGNNSQTITSWADTFKNAKLFAAQAIENRG